MAFKQLDESLADHSGRAQDSDGKFCFEVHKHSSVQEDGVGSRKNGADWEQRFPGCKQLRDARGIDT
jgi:hypothetical protein